MRDNGIPMSNRESHPPVMPRHRSTAHTTLHAKRTFFSPRRAGEKWLSPILLRCAPLRKSQSFTDESSCLGPFAEMFAGIRWRMLLLSLPAADVKNGSLDSRPPLPSLYPARVKVNRRGRHYIQNIVDEVASFVHRSRNRTLGFILAM